MVLAGYVLNSHAILAATERLFRWVAVGGIIVWFWQAMF